jgi:predicted Zn-dependent protease
LLLRVRDEAQLAAILGHEFTHFKEHHSAKMLRDLKSKSAAITWLSFIPFGWVAGLGVAGSVFSYNRDMEREADAGSVVLIARAGYDPHAASRIWEQFRAEMDATALARGKKSRKDKDRGMFEDHPPTAERITTLAALADKQTVAAPVLNRNEYRRAIGPWWQAFVDDQIKLNDFGGTDLLLTQLAAEGWTSDLLYARGELYRYHGKPEDLTKAIGFYRDAIAGTNPSPECYRGLGLALLRSGATAEGQAALRDYLARKPDAADKMMIAAMAGGV